MQRDFESRIKVKEERLGEFKRNYNFISVLRLFITILVLFLFYRIFSVGFTLVLGGFILLSFVFFIFLTKVHELVYQNIIIEENSIKLNKDDTERLNGGWRVFEDKGEEFLDEKHPFINDLNIFGENSFFQWINITETIFGRRKLRDLLLGEKELIKDEIIKRQEALIELSENIELREKIYSALIKNKKRKFNEEEFLDFCEDKNYSFIGKPLNIIRIVGPILTILALAFYITGKMSFIYFLLLFMVNLAVLKFATKEVENGLNLFENIKFVMGGYLEALKAIEKSDFKSSKLKELKNNLLVSGGASSSIKKIYNISAWLYDRKNIFYIILNGLLYWDFQVIYRAEAWKKSEGDKIRKYFESFGEFEALESLSILATKREGYVIPEIKDNFEIEAIELAHPMLKSVAVANSFKLDNNQRVALITGSNMSGKSTFLRTLGFNCFLSYLGLPVRGEKLSIPIMNIYSLMRTGDNLEENISSFYAEILRVKMIVEAAKRGEKILFLLDEIFKGTNSIDRHDGAIVLINQLLKGKSMGLVSTHDLELCALERENKEIVNYNFKEYYKDNKLAFDYKLRKGISNTRNAKYLMKMAGIDI